jgi:hypothetical protein
MSSTEVAAFEVPSDFFDFPSLASFSSVLKLLVGKPAEVDGDADVPDSVALDGVEVLTEVVVGYMSTAIDDL